MMTSSLRKLAGRSLDDIHVVGFLDEEETPVRFQLQLRCIYLSISGELLELHCVEDTGLLRLDIVAQFSAPPDLDDDLRVCVTSVREMVLADPDAENTIVEIELLGALFGPHSTTCSAAQLKLQNGQTLFFDPSYHFGIRIGGIEQRTVWHTNFSQAQVPDSLRWQADPSRDDPAK
jgi:hypothetical protein